jgi:hypothetical protein
VYENRETGSVANGQVEAVGVRNGVQVSFLGSLILLTKSEEGGEGGEEKDDSQRD